MVRYTGKVVVPYSRNRVWNVLADWTNLKHWDANIVRSDRVPNQPEPDHVGTKFSCTFDYNGSKSEVDYTIVKYNVDTKDLAQFEAYSNLLHSIDTLSFADVPGTTNHTEIRGDFNLNFRHVLKPFSFLMNGPMQKIGPKSMQGIESFLHSHLGEK